MAKWMEGVKVFLFHRREVCLHCQCETDEPLVVTVQGDSQRIKQHFCGELCASLYWIERLRKAGM